MMKHKARRIIGPTIAALSLLLIASGIVYALTITVDGIASDWPPPGPQVIMATDPNEAAIPDNVDVSQVFYTANTTKLFGRFDTYGTPTRWTPTTPGLAAPFVWICLDTDNNAGTGATVPQCNGQSGIDFIVIINGSDTGALSTDFRNCTSGACSPAGATMQAASQTNVTEWSVLLNNLG